MDTIEPITHDGAMKKPIETDTAPLPWAPSELTDARDAAARAMPRVEPAHAARMFDAGLSVLEPAIAALVAERDALLRREENRSLSDARAMKRWMAEHAPDERLPAGGDLVVWLLEERRRLLHAVDLVDARTVRMPKGLSEGFAEAMGRAWTNAAAEGVEASWAAVVAVAEPWRQNLLPELLKASPGDMEGHDDNERSVAVMREAYGWTVGSDGRLYGLVAGDMGYAATHIVLSSDDIGLEGWKEESSNVSRYAVLRMTEEHRDMWAARHADVPSSQDGSDDRDAAWTAGYVAGGYAAADWSMSMLYGIRPEALPSAEEALERWKKDEPAVAGDKFGI
jgi:hypothetical protein